jgi:hypothetical protein
MIKLDELKYSFYIRDYKIIHGPSIKKIIHLQNHTWSSIKKIIITLTQG